MGACCGKESPAGKYAVAEPDKPAPVVKKVPVWEQKKPDIKDFSFMGLKGETRFKEPGQIDGQQFIIENCEDCDLWVLDKSAAVTIDDCKNCRIFLGPVESSVFIRDCSDCKLVAITRQFRTRDCKNLDASLLCASRPIIESSSPVRFGCYDLEYVGLQQQLASLNFTPLRNFWGYVHDFTPGKGHIQLLPADATSASLMGAAPDVACLRGAAAAPPAVLRTHGERPPVSEDGCFLLLPPALAGEAVAVAREGAATGATLSRTNTVQLDERTAATLLERAGRGAERALHKALTEGKSAGLEFQGAGCEAALKELAQRRGAVLVPGRDGGAEYRFMGIEG